MRIENFGPLGFSCDFTAMQIKKCITIHVLLGNIRPRFRYRKMQVLWRFQGARPLNLHQDSTMELLLAAPASTQMYCAITDGHCILCLRHDTRPDQEAKKSLGEGRHQSGCFPGSFTLTMPLVLALFILQATCSTVAMGLSLRGSDFRTQLPPKIGSLAKLFSLGPSPM